MGLPDAKTVTAMPDKRRASYAGMVINRQWQQGQEKKDNHA